MAKILIVDDELSMREFLGILLRKQGYEVTSVSSGEEAVAQVDREFYDVVLTDLKMSGMSGLDVLRQVSDRSPGTQVIMMTAYATAETAISGRTVPLGVSCTPADSASVSGSPSAPLKASAGRSTLGR